MADNYLENKREAYDRREAEEKKRRQAAYRRRMDAYRKKLAGEHAGDKSDGHLESGLQVEAVSKE